MCLHFLYYLYLSIFVRLFSHLLPSRAGKYFRNLNPLAGVAAVSYSIQSTRTLRNTRRRRGDINFIRLYKSIRQCRICEGNIRVILANINSVVLFIRVIFAADIFSILFTSFLLFKNKTVSHVVCFCFVLFPSGYIFSNVLRLGV